MRARARETNWPRCMHSALYIDTVNVMCAKYSIDIILYIALVPSEARLHSGSR